MKNKHFDDSPLQCFDNSLELAFRECMQREQNQLQHILNEILELESFSRLQNDSDCQEENQ